MKKNNALEAEANALRGDLLASQDALKSLKADLAEAHSELRSALDAKLQLESQMHALERASSQQQSDVAYQLHGLRQSLAAQAEEG